MFRFGRSVSLRAGTAAPFAPQRAHVRPNAISRLIFGDPIAETRLGCPSADDGAKDRRMAAMAQMTGGHGFRQWPAGPKLSRGGKTRRERIASGELRPRLLKVCP
jgi:hypothetical protein